MSWLSFIPVIGQIANAVSGYFNKKLDTDLEKYKVDGKIDETLISAEVAIIQAKANASSHLNFAHYLFIVPTGVYYACILFDAVTEALFGWDWDVQPLGGWAAFTAQLIISFLFLHSALRVYRR
jgi:hypothetical protein